eukprot:m.88484 g.88484  ORF g.88484 m.88484 type:complete len:978 (+) comp13167_c0_seq2:1231-4164(+)
MSSKRSRSLYGETNIGGGQGKRSSELAFDINEPGQTPLEGNLDEFFRRKKPALKKETPVLRATTRTRNSFLTQRVSRRLSKEKLSRASLIIDNDNARKEKDKGARAQRETRGGKHREAPEGTEAHGETQETGASFNGPLSVTLYINRVLVGGKEQEMKITKTSLSVDQKKLIIPLQFKNEYICLYLEQLEPQDIQGNLIPGKGDFGIVVDLQNFCHQQSDKHSHQKWRSFFEKCQTKDLKLVIHLNKSPFKDAKEYANFFKKVSERTCLSGLIPNLKKESEFKATLVRYHEVNLGRNRGKKRTNTGSSGSDSKHDSQKTEENSVIVIDDDDEEVVEVIQPRKLRRRSRRDPHAHVVTYPKGKGGITITGEDMERLEPEMFLNDVLINFYLKYLTHEKLTPLARDRVHIFSTFLYKRLTQNGRSEPKVTEEYKKVARWTGSVNLFQKDFLLFPVNENAHWFLVIVCYPGKSKFTSWESTTVAKSENSEHPTLKQNEVVSLENENKAISASDSVKDGSVSVTHEKDSNKNNDDIVESPIVVENNATENNTEKPPESCERANTSKETQVDGPEKSSADSDPTAQFSQTSHENLTRYESNDCVEDAESQPLLEQDLEIMARKAAKMEPPDPPPTPPENEVVLQLNQGEESELSKSKDDAIEPEAKFRESEAFETAPEDSNTVIELQSENDQLKSATITTTDADESESQPLLDQDAEPELSEQIPGPTGDILDSCETKSEPPLLVEKDMPELVRVTANVRGPASESNEPSDPDAEAAIKGVENLKFENHTPRTRSVTRNSESCDILELEEPPPNQAKIPKKNRRKKSSRKMSTSDAPLPQRPCILLFDSLGHNRSNSYKVIKSYLAAVFKDQYKGSEDSQEYKARVEEIKGMKGFSVKAPKQNNFCDCGVFLLHYAEVFLRNPLGLADYSDTALKVDLDIKNTEIGLQHWTTDMNEKRKHIEILIDCEFYYILFQICSCILR